MKDKDRKRQRELLGAMIEFEKLLPSDAVFLVVVGYADGLVRIAAPSARDEEEFENLAAFIVEAPDHVRHWSEALLSNSPDVERVSAYTTKPEMPE